MIDAGYNYERLAEKMEWLNVDPASVQHILITHQDTDHVGALEQDSEQFFRHATVYIGEIENRYLNMFHSYVLYKNMMPESKESFIRIKNFVCENLDIKIN